MTSRIQQHKDEKLLKELARLPENKRCAVCTCVGTQYTCQPPSIYVCETCAGVVRRFPGFRVKSRTMATYSTAEVQAMKDGGNQKFNKTYLAAWNSAAFPAPVDKNPKKIETFISQVLVEKNFFEEAQEEPHTQVVTPSTAGSTTLKMRTGSLSVDAQPGWNAFGPSSGAPKPSVSIQSTRPSSAASTVDSSWAVFPAPSAAQPTSSEPPAQTLTAPVADPFAVPATQTPPVQASAPVGLGQAPATGTVGNAPAAVSDEKSPAGWSTFDEGDPFGPTSKAANGNDPAGDKTAGSVGSNAGTPSTATSLSKNKQPTMKELPENWFSNIPDTQTASNPFGSAVATQPAYTQMNAAFPAQHPTPTPPRPQVNHVNAQFAGAFASQPVANPQPFQQPAYQMQQHFPPQQAQPYLSQQGQPQGVMYNAVPGATQQAGFPINNGSIPTNQSQYSASVTSQSPDKAGFLFSPKKEEEDPTLFRNLVGDLKETLPRTHSRGVGSMGAGAFPNMPQYGGMPGAPPAYGGVPHMAGVPNMTGFGQQPQTGYGAMPNKMMGPPQTGFGGGVQPSGNPFA